MTNLHDRAARDFASSPSCEQMVTEPTQIDGGMLHLVLTDIPDVVEIGAGMPVGTSDHSAIFEDVVLELFFTWCVGRRSISRTLLSESWLEEM